MVGVSLTEHLLSMSLTEYLWTCVLACLVYLFIQYIQTVRDCRLRYPPGPTLWPLFYNKILYLLSFKALSRKLNEWRSYYGDIITIYIDTPVVYIQGYEAIKEAFVDNARSLSDRPGGSATHFGITFGSAPAWKHLRKHLVNYLMEPENRRSGLEKKIQEEMGYLLSECDKLVDKPFELSQILQPASANITCYSLFGKRFDYDAPECSIKTANNSERFTVLTRVADTFPIFKVFPQLLPRFAEASASRATTRTFAKIQYEEHLRSLDPSHPRDYIDSMLLQTAEKDDPTYLESFSEAHIRESIVSLFIAGSDTSRASLCWAFLFAALHPEMQDKVRQEIDDIIGSRLPTFQDYLDMPFTQAFLTESMRMRPVGAESLPHISTEDVIVKGQTIPEGTVVYANIYSVTHDETLFGSETEKFNPGRFLKEGGKFVKPNKFIVFGIGRRKCPGELIGKLVTPMFFTAILQQYRVTLPESQQIDIYGEQYGVYMTSKYDIILHKR